MLSKQNTQPHALLTIAIPTYNRQQLLKEQIAALLPQLSDQVKALILDNHSEPSVSFCLGELCGDRIEIVRNRVNIGGDANICRCFELCETEWLWVLSDDDRIKEDAVSCVLERIAANRDRVFITYKTGSDVVTEGLEGFCKSRPFYAATFAISYCLYNAAKLRTELIHYYNYLTSWHGQLILVLKYLENHGDATCLFCEYTPIRRAIKPQWCKASFIERWPVFFSAFQGQTLRLVKEAFSGDMVSLLLQFSNSFRMQDGFSRRQQVRLFFKTMAQFDLKYLLIKNNANQLLLFSACFVSPKAAAKALCFYRAHVPNVKLSGS